MAANWRVNAILGLSAFLFTYIFSIVSNTWITSLLRAGAGFFLFFISGYILRFVIHQKNSILQQEELEEGNLDFSYVKETEMNDSSFQTISLGSLHNKEDDKNPILISDTIRTWMKDDKEG